MSETNSWISIPSVLSNTVSTMLSAKVGSFANLSLTVFFTASKTSTMRPAHTGSPTSSLIAAFMFASFATTMCYAFSGKNLRQLWAIRMRANTTSMESTKRFRRRFYCFSYATFILTFAKIKFASIFVNPTKGLVGACLRFGSNFSITVSKFTINPMDVTIFQAFTRNWIAAIEFRTTMLNAVIIFLIISTFMAVAELTLMFIAGFLTLFKELQAVCTTASVATAMMQTKRPIPNNFLFETALCFTVTAFAMVFAIP
mmetsp:Transcript_4670/g.5898  ORF Transcript_4670/g.5898 Transcript_4670/m.5898 type:complete len:257 (-) Transcript_4670:690-1460(-)